MNKNKGCRDSETIRIDFTNVAAAYGAANYRQNTTLPAEIAGLRKRLDELHLELDEARLQESKAKLKIADDATAATPAEPSMSEVVQ